MAYGVGGNGVVQILDRNKVLTGCVARPGCATSPTQAEMLAPQKGFFTLPGLTLQGGHTSFPDLWGGERKASQYSPRFFRRRGQRVLGRKRTPRLVVV